MESLNWIQNINSLDPGLLFVVMAWTMAWKGVALWKAAQKKQVYWFVALLILNTVGALEILYIFVFSSWKRKEEKKEKSESAE